MKPVVVQGIVLRRTDFREADRIIQVLTDTSGKLGMIAKGARKQRSKLAGGIELLSINQLTYVQGKGQLATITSSRGVKTFNQIVKDYDRVSVAYSTLQAVDKVTEETAGREYFQLAESTLTALDSDMSLDTIRLWFAIRLMALMGSLPNLTQSVDGSALQADQSYNFSFDDMCFVAAESGAYGPNHIKVLRLAASAATPQVVAAVDGIDQLSESLQRLTQAIAGHQLHLEL